MLDAGADSTEARGTSRTERTKSAGDGIFVRLKHIEARRSEPNARGKNETFRLLAGRPHMRLGPQRSIFGRQRGGHVPEENYRCTGRNAIKNSGATNRNLDCPSRSSPVDTRHGVRIRRKPAPRQYGCTRTRYLCQLPRNAYGGQWRYGHGSNNLHPRRRSRLDDGKYTYDRRI